MENNFKMVAKPFGFEEILAKNYWGAQDVESKV
jgi:hypothetical protein